MQAKPELIFFFFNLGKHLSSWRDMYQFLNIEKGQNNIRFTHAIWLSEYNEFSAGLNYALYMKRHKNKFVFHIMLQILIWGTIGNHIEFRWYNFFFDLIPKLFEISQAQLQNHGQLQISEQSETLSTNSIYKFISLGEVWMISSPLLTRRTKRFISKKRATCLWHHLFAAYKGVNLSLLHTKELVYHLK